MVDYEYAELFNNDSLDKQIHITASGGINLGNDDLVSESFQLIESLCSEEYLTFGAVEPRCVRFTVKYSAPKLINKWLTITMDLQGAETPFSFGDYQVLSDKPSSDRTTREVTAYSHFHKILQNKYKSWYKAAWGDSNAMTIKQLRDSFFARLQQTHSWVVQETTTLVNDDMVIKKSKKIPRISGKDILNAICEINGVFGYIDRDNVFRYKTLADSSASTNIGSAYTISTEYEDYATIAVDRVEIYAESGELLGDAGASAATSQNKYVIENNFMLKGLGTNADAQLIAHFLAQNVLSVIGNVTYVPFDADFKGNPCFEVGDRISFQSHGNTIYSYILSRTLKGIQSLRDNYTAESGDAVYPEDRNALSSKMQKIKDYASEKAESTLDVFDPNIEGLAGVEGDGYVQTGSISTKLSKYPMVFNRIYVCNGRAGSGIHTTPNPIVVDANGYYDFSVGGTCYGVLDGYPTDYENGSNIFKIKMNGAGIYRWTCKINADWSRANSATGWAKMGFAFNRTNYDKALHSGFFEALPMGHNAVSEHGYAVNISDEKNTDIEYTGTFVINENDLTDDTMYMWVMFNRVVPITAGEPSGGWGTARMTFKDFHIEKKLDGSSDFDGGVDTEVENYIGSTYVYQEDENNESGGSWQEVKRVAGVDTSESAGGTLNNGLALSSNGKNELSLKPNVMRAWVKADPPQTQRNFNQFCVRYTGAPATGVNISYHGASNWSNTSVKKSDDGAYTIKCGGTRTSGVDYVAYKIEGLTSGKKYYFNFASNIGDNATFTNDDTKGLGVVFNTTGVINTDTWNGEPDTWNENTLYYSMYRSVSKNYIDFSFTATASTMYMCVVVADITVGTTTTMTFTDFVLSESERKYIRNFYLFDVDTNEWLQFRPFGTNDGGGVDVSALSELSDVALENLANGQIIKYNANTQKWVNADEFSLPTASESVLGGIKVGGNLTIDENGSLSVSISLDDLTDIDLESLSNGQMLRYNQTSQKWENIDNTGSILSGTTVPSNSIGADGDIYYQYSTSQGGDWTADDEYLVTDANTIFADDGTRTWNKTNSGKAIAVYLSGTWSGGMLVSQDADACRYTNQAGSSNVQSAVIDGETWYSSTPAAWWGVVKTNTNGVAPNVSYDYSTQNPATASVIIPFILDKANMRHVSVANAIVATFFKKDGVWLQDNTGGGGSSTIVGLSDVDVSNLSHGQILKYNSATEKWENTADTGGADAVEITWSAYQALTAEQKADPTKVYYVTDYPTPSGIDLGDIDDVDLSSPTDGQVLKYDGTNQKWINANESGGGTPSMSDWGWNVLHKTIEWSGGFAPDAYSLVSYIEYVKPSSMIGKMVIVQGVHVYGSTDGTTFNDTLDFDLHYVYNRTNQSDEEVVYIGGLVHNHSSVTFTHLKFSANVIYI